MRRRFIINFLNQNIMRKIHVLALIRSLVMLSSCEKPVIGDGSFIDEDGTGEEG